MSDKIEVDGSGGIGLFTALFMIFLVLKLTGHIEWSWWWVTAPLWGPFVLVIAIVFLAMCLYTLGEFAAFVERKING